MAKRTQKQRVIGKLKRDGYITRNECLDMPYGDKITRLGAIICDLRKNNWEFETLDKDNDYKYIWVNKKVEPRYEIINGVAKLIK